MTLERYAVVLGAGFSRAVSDAFPLVDELGERVRLRVPDAMTAAPPVFRGGSFERWLSRIAEPQPDLTEAANLGNARDFQLVAQAIHAVMVEAEAEVVTEPAKWWLLRFLGVLHRLRATVVTLNYDTVVEAASGRLGSQRDQGVINAFSLTNGIPPTPARPGMFGPNHIETFRLLKLHGSVDAYWVPGDVTGATINRVADAMWFPDTGMSSPSLDLARVAPGRVPFIVPPASAKSAFFANPITRQIWRTAAERLAASDEIAIVGYSMPLTDLVAGAMLGDAHRAGGAQFQVVNINPGEVVDHVCGAANVDSTHVHVAASSVSDYVDDLEDRAASHNFPELLAALDGDRPLLARTQAGASPSVVGWHADRETLVLECGDQARDDIAPPGTKPASDLAAALQRTGLTRIALEASGERALIIDQFEKSAGSDYPLWLVPSAFRIA